MPFTLNPEVGAALANFFGAEPPPQAPVGDWKARREGLDPLFKKLRDAQPAIQDVDVKDFHAKADDGHEILCRWITKQGTTLKDSPAVLYTHGGGMIALSIDLYDQVIKRYVTRTGVPFMMIEYRLAPEAQAPVPVKDVYAGLQYLHSNAASLGIDPKRIAIMGDSAGGGLTASLAHYVQAQGGPAVCKQILIYPMLDDRSTETDPEIAAFCTWSVDDNKTGWSAYLGDDRMISADVKPTEAAGRMTVEDAKGLPPTYIDAGELDLFRDENLEYARKLGKAGVSCELHLIPGVPHAAEGFAPESEVGRMVMDLRYAVVRSF